MQAIFEKQTFGEVERLITQKLFDVVKQVAREESENEHWLRLMASVSNRSYEDMRVSILELLDTDVFDLWMENYISFLDPLVESWNIDPPTFGVEIALKGELAPGLTKGFEFIEMEPEPALDEDPGLKEFLCDSSLSGDATEEKIEFLKTLIQWETAYRPLLLSGTGKS